MTRLAAPAVIALLLAVPTGCMWFEARTDPSKQLVITIADDQTRPSPFGDGATLGTRRESAISKILQLHGLKRIAQWPIKALGLSAIVAEVRSGKSLREVIDALRKDKRIQSVETIKTYEVLTYNDPYFKLQNISVGRELERIHGFATGKDVVVGLVDTGIDRRHPELAGKITFAANFVDHDQHHFDSDEHGTAVAGIIASSANNEVGIVGVAPDVKLMAFKACAEIGRTRRATCDSVSLIKALIEVINRRPDVVNLSLAGPDDPLIRRLLKVASDQGMILIAATNGKSASSFPASMPEVIAVATPMMLGGPRKGRPEGRAAPVVKSAEGGTSVVAPGTDVLTTTPGATYGFKSGSSIATAYVSGSAALIRGREPTMSTADIRAQLVGSSSVRVGAVPVLSMCAAVSGPQDADLCAGLAAHGQ